MAGGSLCFRLGSLREYKIRLNCSLSGAKVGSMKSTKKSKTYEESDVLFILLTLDSLDLVGNMFIYVFLVMISLD